MEKERVKHRIYLSLVLKRAFMDTFEMLLYYNDDESIGEVSANSKIKRERPNRNSHVFRYQIYVFLAF